MKKITSIILLSSVMLMANNGYINNIKQESFENMKFNNIEKTTEFKNFIYENMKFSKSNKILSENLKLTQKLNDCYKNSNIKNINSCSIIDNKINYSDVLMSYYSNTLNNFDRMNELTDSEKDVVLDSIYNYTRLSILNMEKNIKNTDTKILIDNLKSNNSKFLIAKQNNSLTINQQIEEGKKLILSSEPVLKEISKI